MATKRGNRWKRSLELNEFGRRVRDLASEAYPNFTDFLEAAGISQASMHAYETSDRRPKLDRLTRMATLLEVSPAELLGPARDAEKARLAATGARDEYRSMRAALVAAEKLNSQARVEVKPDGVSVPMPPEQVAKLADLFLETEIFRLAQRARQTLSPRDGRMLLTASTEEWRDLLYDDSRRSVPSDEWFDAHPMTPAQAAEMANSGLHPDAFYALLGERDEDPDE